MDDLFDYDDLSLGVDFDLPTNQGGVVIPGVEGILPPGYGARPVAGNRPGFRTRVPTGVLHHPTGVAHSHRRRVSLWRKLYYLDYLRRVYAR